MIPGDLYQLATSVQAQLLDGGGEIMDQPRILLDTWASLTRWNLEGEHLQQLTEADVSAARRLRPDPDFALATPVDPRAVAYQLPLPATPWIVLARHDAGEEIVIHSDRRFAFRQPILSYCVRVGTGLGAGYISLVDQPTLAALNLQPGSKLTIGGPGKLAQADIREEAIALAITIPFFYSLT